ncbi:MAG TPA: MmcQ/YjbR family DNA-binding protein [Polyangia bacterium]|jgi:predicted DNA-binding protein (MmcQ/YjbR family)|nr:MmcQ/YjbR family DNA-binding protein [Polyangia bacterium]
MVAAARKAARPQRGAAKKPTKTPAKRAAKKTSAAPRAGAAEAALCRYALSLPNAREEFPWGHRVAKVGKKIFVTFGNDERAFSMSVKLPRGAEFALALPFAEPTGYGLGKSGWVTARFAAKEAPPLDLLRAWIDESYRAVAPKKLVAALDGR